jgi:hypothetical protein
MSFVTQFLQGLFLHYQGKVTQIDATVQDARDLLCVAISSVMCANGYRFRGDSLVVASRNVMYYDFAVRPPPIPAAASRLPVFSDEAMESDAPDEMQPAHAEADLFEEDDDE